MGHNNKQMKIEQLAVYNSMTIYFIVKDVKAFLKFNIQ